VFPAFSHTVRRYRTRQWVDLPFNIEEWCSCCVPSDNHVHEEARNGGVSNMHIYLTALSPMKNAPPPSTDSLLSHFQTCYWTPGRIFLLVVPPTYLSKGKRLTPQSSGGSLFFPSFCSHRWIFSFLLRFKVDVTPPTKAPLPQ